MNTKTLVWVGMIVGTTVGGMLPMLWGDGYLSMSSVLLTMVGGILGIYIGFKLGTMF
jgi:Mg/Co/Ni transporter MgtE